MSLDLDGYDSARCRCETRIVARQVNLESPFGINRKENQEFFLIHLWDGSD